MVWSTCPSARSVGSGSEKSTGPNDVVETPEPVQPPPTAKPIGQREASRFGQLARCSHKRERQKQGATLFAKEPIELGCRGRPRTAGEPPASQGARRMLLTAVRALRVQAVYAATVHRLQSGTGVASPENPMGGQPNDR